MSKYNEVSDVPQEPSQTVYSNGWLGAVITAANVLVSAVLIGAMYYDSRSATAAALAGVVYFMLSMTLTLLTLSGALAHIVTNGQQQKTVRQLHQLQYRAQRPPQLADPLQLPYREPLAQPRLSSFVAPVADVDESAKREAGAWLAQLFDANGDPDPKKVLMKSDKERPGRVRVAAPSRPAKQWLMNHGILLDLGGTGFRLNLVRCPTRDAASTQFNLAAGVGQLPTTRLHPELVSGGEGAL